MLDPIAREFYALLLCRIVEFLQIGRAPLMSRRAKSILRKLVNERLNQLEKEKIQLQSDLIFKTLLKDPQFQNARRIGVYMSMPSLEVDTHKLIEYCFNLNKEVYLPTCIERVDNLRRYRHMNLLKVSSMDAVRQLRPKGKFNLREPEEGESIMDKGGLDVLVLPGLAFTKAGERLGHGAGYYDEFLNAYEIEFGNVPYLVGLSLREQIVDRIPMEAHDRILDTVLVGGDSA